MTDSDLESIIFVVVCELRRTVWRSEGDEQIIFRGKREKEYRKFVFDNLYIQYFNSDNVNVLVEKRESL